MMHGRFATNGGSFAKAVPINVAALILVAGLVTMAACASSAVPLVALASPPCEEAGRSVSWFGPTADEHRKLLDDWCRSVGVAVVRAPIVPAIQPDSCPGVSRDVQVRLGVVSWNVHEGAGDLVRVVTELRNRCVHTHMIVLVQEALRTGPQVPAAIPENVHAPARESAHRAAVADIVDAAERLGMWLAYVPSMRNGREAREDRGCAILSTTPLVDPIAIELPWVAQRRVAVAAVTRLTPMQAVRVVSVHLDNRPGRREQSDALAHWLRESIGDEMPTIIGADLNTWFGSGEETVQQIARFVPLAPGCGERPTFRFGRRLDYLFTSATNVVSCKVVDETYGSDHHPLIMEIGELDNW